ncbi:FAD-dependent oxidoreductase [Botrimarina mediterranea]|uniref:Tricarballylate dehydrogenase n=1 Tax=Botrimarina mediterranea TaxID=2528022 RepID=A0A518KA87_9BACT|nr:FAD-dependent oxidoreductase [Botrimarina mediterranea]QDV74693.1 tricarballylate dehydrogenase [Botrimarina mediterranea]QDV79331.1 tricarballylate dehydrogenase [Planctomycetes bacterium K2D]
MKRLLLTLLVALATSTCDAASGERPSILRFDVVIAGGSTAALAAAFAAAEEGASVALVEPTDWIGGQLTSSGVPAIDEAWHKVVADDGKLLLDVARVARDPRNMTPFFRDALAAIGNPGGGWVSRYCFEPKELLDAFLVPREHELAPRLSIFRDTVVKRAETNGRRITALEAIRRTPRLNVDSYDRLPSQEIEDWYSPDDSRRFTKETLRLEGSVFIDASEWGELLALSDAPYLQGAEVSEDSLDGNDTLGQSTVYCFVQRMHAKPVAMHPQFRTVEGLGFGDYCNRPDAWQKIWTYRRVLGDGSSAAPGQLSLQNWGYSLRHNEGGNDFPFGYLFLSKEETAAQRDDWCGGVAINVLAAAERRAFAWHDWFRRAAPEPLDPDQFTLDGACLGTRHGLAKLPYVRDTRRSIGAGGFVLKLSDLVGQIDEHDLVSRTGTVFPDRVALGAYPADIHPLVGYEYPPHVLENHPTLPFYLPLRSLTNDGFDNLLVAGKTMAQTFLANSATRLHPIEWSSGTACGVVAAHIAQNNLTTIEVLDDYERLRMKISRRTPVDWTLPNR